MLRVYWVYLKTSLAVQFQYRAAMVIWMVNRIVEPTIYLVVWTTVAAAQGSVAGYEAGDFAAYFIVLMVVNQLTFTWVMHEYDWRVRSGELSAVLLKPIHPIHSDIADNVGYKVLTSVVMLPAAIVLTLVFRPPFAFEPLHLLVFVPALALAYLIRFFVEWVLALIAFWTTRVTAVNQVYFLVFLFMSGRLAPLEVMPPWIQSIAWVLPFRWTVAFPVEVALGRLTTAQIASGLQMQLVWFAAGLALVWLGWRRGIRKYTAVGS